MGRTAGEIRNINRYPVKSMAGEALEECRIEPYGMLGDRVGTFYDESKSDWWKYITVRNIPGLFTYQAKFVEGEVRVTGPDGRVFGWDQELLDEIQSRTETVIAMSPLYAPHPEHPHLLSVEGASILLLTDATLRRLEALWGKPLDQRRFRGNFIVAVDGDSEFEGDWIGKKLTIGEVTLQVDSYCERCVVITMDPDTLEKDPSLHKIVTEEFGNHFGVYASVVTPGRIQIGDKVTVEE